MAHPPADVCRALHELHVRNKRMPQVRLGWDPQEGAYGLIQLFPRRTADRTYRERWDRGPVFSRTGRPIRDWDYWTRVPVYMIDVSPADVHSGKVIELVKHWVRPIAARLHENAMERSSQIEERAKAMGEQMGDELYKAGQADGAGAPIVAKKFQEDTPNMKRYREGGMDFSKSQLPPPPPGGWDKHLARDEGDAS